MFLQHQIVCESKEIVLYLFLREQENLDLKAMKTIFSHLSALMLETRILEYLKQDQIKFFGRRVRVVCGATIIKDFYLNQQPTQNKNTAAKNIVYFHRLSNQNRSSI